jgi:ligand-binding SRPBCC domain-containing protein
MQFQHELVIERPIEEVFDYLADARHLPEWQTSVVSAKPEAEGPLADGSRFRETRSMMGRRMESTLEVVAYARPTRFCVRTVTGPMPYEVRHELEARGGATHILFQLEGEPQGVMRLAGGMAVRAARRQAQADFARLKAVLEGSP